jgi:hypothetical protein
MHLSDAMRAELERRLAEIAREQADDPAFRDLPSADVAALVMLLAVAVVGTVLLQAT